LQDHAEDVGVVVHRDETRLSLILRERGRPDLFFEAQTDLLCGIRLTADVHRRRFVCANADRYETADRVIDRGLADVFGDFSENAIADRASVEQAMVL